MRPVTSTFFVLVMLCGLGCRPGEMREDFRRQLVDDFGHLPGLRETPDPRLQDELARIIDEGGTPELLTQNQVPDEENVAAGLYGLFETEEIESIRDQSDEIVPPGRFTFDPTRLERAIRFRQKHQLQRQRAREALQRPRCNFGFQYTAGFGADQSLVDVAWICARLEAFQAAESLAAADTAAAIESLRYIFRLASCLAAEKHATARLEAALIRAEALRVVRAVVAYPDIKQPKVTRDQLGRLCTMIEDQLKAWPDDAGAWIGDRALGMHAYELVRAGRLVELLTEDEIQLFADEEILEDLPAAARRTVNQDELYYLEAMRRIIDSCQKAYHERAEVFESIRQDLHQKRNTPEFPLVAGRLLLPHIDKGHAIQARDRAGCEAWAVALASACGRKPPPYQVSPLTGEKYRLVRQEGQVEVWDAGPEETTPAPLAVVPDLAGASSAE